MPARIGLIVPASNRMVEQEMVRHMPPDVVAHVMRLRMTGEHRVTLDALLPQVNHAVGLLLDARCDLVAFHCTANSTADGLSGEARLLDAVRQAGAALATTTATAVRRALDTLGARRIVLLTPYSQHTADEEAGFLREAGFEVPLARGFGLKGSDEYCATPSQFWRDRALEAAQPDADAYFLSCANISVFSIVDEVEELLGRPVVTSNQVVIWDALALLGISDRRNCPGRLFDSLSAEKSVRRMHA